MSWLEDTKKAPRGTFEIKVYDDEGYAAVRKVFIRNFKVLEFKILNLHLFSRLNVAAKILALSNLLAPSAFTTP